MSQLSTQRLIENPRLALTGTRVVFLLKDIVSVFDGDGLRDARVAVVQSVLVAGPAVRCKICCCSREEAL